MHVAIVGGSDTGIDAARRCRELDPDVRVSLLVADAFPNYSICGIPYPETHHPQPARQCDLVEHRPPAPDLVDAGSRADAVDRLCRKAHSADDRELAGARALTEVLMMVPVVVLVRPVTIGSLRWVDEVLARETAAESRPDPAINEVVLVRDALVRRQP